MRRMHTLQTDGLYRALGVCALAFAAGGFAAGAFGVRINTSYSLPMGLYIETSAADAPYVEFCPQGRFAEESSQRGYRTPGFACPDGAVPLLKPVVARAGDRVETSRTGIAVNGVPLPKTAPLDVDSARRSLTPWPFGSYSVQAGTIWVASTYHPNSYDSRYMGPIPESLIRRKLRALWTL
jgi:conjugative transfer signal peptidase TraF